MHVHMNPNATEQDVREWEIFQVKLLVEGLVNEYLNEKNTKELTRIAKILSDKYLGEEKKYYLYLKRTKPKFFDDVGSYLTFNTYTNTFSIDVGVETAHLTAQFTQKEINEIKEKFNTDLEEFKQIKVK